MLLMPQRRQELAWHGIETNEFGTDEFLKWCEIVGTEPYLALNFGTGVFIQNGGGHALSRPKDRET